MITAPVLNRHLLLYQNICILGLPVLFWITYDRVYFIFMYEGWGVLQKYISSKHILIANHSHWWFFYQHPLMLTHWGRVTHICVGNPTIIGSDDGLSPGRRQAIIWTNDGWNIVDSNLRNKLQWNPRGKFIHFHFRKCIWKCCLRNGVYLVSASMS